VPRGPQRPARGGRGPGASLGPAGARVDRRDSENEVPLGVTRTYVKSVEVGIFPQVRRAFQVTRCNQCADAPCTTACPTRAMYRRPDGIVDFDKSVCIGCKACIAACPYDAIFINPEDNSAEKCNLCAHRVEGRADRQPRPGHGPAAGEGHPAGPVLQGSPPSDAGPPGSAAARRRPVRVGDAGRRARPRARSRRSPGAAQLQRRGPAVLRHPPPAEACPALTASGYQAVVLQAGQLPGHVGWEPRSPATRSVPQRRVAR
jgi:ferredoxin